MVEKKQIYEGRLDNVKDLKLLAKAERLIGAFGYLDSDVYDMIKKGVISVFYRINHKERTFRATVRINVDGVFIPNDVAYRCAQAFIKLAKDLKI